jgi:protein SCO1/2
MRHLFLFILLLAGCSNSPNLASYGVVPDFVLTDQSDRTFVSADALKGKVWVANFIFTTCAGPCPRMSNQMRQLRDSVSELRNVRLLSFTIDPIRDTPSVLASYSKHYAADPDQWYFLTGAQADLHRLKKDTFMLGAVDGTLEHSTRFVLVDEQSRIRGFYDSSDGESMAKMLEDLKGLAKGANS